MTNVSIIDQPRWPAMDAETTPAFLDFKLVFKAMDEPVEYGDPARQYRFEGFKAEAELEATVRVPSIDFIFKMIRWRPQSVTSPSWVLKSMGNISRRKGAEPPKPSFT